VLEAEQMRQRTVDLGQPPQDAQDQRP
jgi:hypothetical protein